MTKKTKSPPHPAADLGRLSVTQLVERYEAEWGRRPRVQNASWLRKQILRRVAERECGGLSKPAQARLEQLMAQIVIPPAPGDEPREEQGELPIGAVLQRTWKGEQVRVERTERGFAWNGETYSSLSAVAKAITGSHMSGHRFFGLTPGRKA